MPDTTAPGPAICGDEADLFPTHAERIVRVVSRQVDAPEWIVEDGCQFA